VPHAVGGLHEHALKPDTGDTPHDRFAPRDVAAKPDRVTNGELHAHSSSLDRRRFPAESTHRTAPSR
jgi:hypothetical protein